MKVVKKTGLVPVKLHIAYSTGFPGNIIGVSPTKAKDMVRKKEAELVAIPEGIDTVDALDPNPIAEDTTAEPDDRDKVEIPDEWESMHPLRKIAIAKSLVDPLEIRDGEKTGEAAERTIREELDRRQANTDVGS
jgi:hypothetical protein